MARLVEQIEIIISWMQARHPDIRFGEQCAREMEEMIRRSMPGEKVYVPAPDTSKSLKIAEAVKTLPTSVVADRFGVHPSWARKLARRGVTKRK